MAENQKPVMEKSMASLTISSPPRDPIDGCEPCSAERFDVDAGFETFFAMCDKLKSMSYYPATIPERVTHIPGTDCFRHNTAQGRRDKMADYYPMALAYFNKKYNTDYEFVDCVDLIASGVDNNYACHCNFTAKPESAPFKPGDFSTKLFFAEFMYTPVAKSSLTFCSMLDGAEAACEGDCSICPEGSITHPASFKSGLKKSLM